jgi:hypothetical protein
MKTKNANQINAELIAAAKAALDLWKKHGLGDDAAESEPVYNALAAAIRNATPADPELVHPADGCPNCGERDTDMLIWMNDEHDSPLRCMTCGKRYAI